MDFNRSGVPLLEIVSEPDLHAVDEVLGYATALRTLLQYLGVNSGDMEKGVMRFEANVSLRPKDSETLGTRGRDQEPEFVPGHGPGHRTRTRAPGRRADRRPTHCPGNTWMGRDCGR